MSFVIKCNRIAADSTADAASGRGGREPRRADVFFLKQGVRDPGEAAALFQTVDEALRLIKGKWACMAEPVSDGGDSSRRPPLDSDFQAMAVRIARLVKAMDCNGVTPQGDRRSGSCDSGRPQPSAVRNVDRDTGHAAGDDRPGDTAVSPATREQVRKTLEKFSGIMARRDNARVCLGLPRNSSGNADPYPNIQAENLQAAESRIFDAAVAMKMTPFVRRRIVTQSAVIRLIQAADFSESTGGSAANSVDSR